MKMLSAILGMLLVAAMPTTMPFVSSSQPAGLAEGDQDLRVPKDGFARKGTEWFKTEQALRFADNCLTYQTPVGGWPKNLDVLSAPRDPNHAAKGFANSGTFDNGSTVPQIRFMGAMYKATGQKRFKDAYLRGVDFVLNAQYPNGGWPQYYPNPKGYRACITFNDGAMINVLRFVRDLVNHPDADLLDDARMQRAKQALDKGLECILRCQICLDGRLTAWCAQHDPNTLAPAKARSYELPSISGGESAAILSFLLDIREPGPQVRQAIEAATEWFQRSKITGLREEIRDGDKVLVADPNAPAMWARFYDIQTNRPMFCGRDGEVKWSLSEIDQERRVGYSWYTDEGAKILLKYEKWRQSQGQ
jgi:pectate lyase